MPVQADNLLEAGNHTLTNIIVGPSRQRRVATETRPTRNNVKVDGISLLFVTDLTTSMVQVLQKQITYKEPTRLTPSSASTVPTRLLPQPLNLPNRFSP